MRDDDPLEIWAELVAPKELIERKLEIATKATALEGVLDDPLATCTRAVEAARSRLGLRAAVQDSTGTSAAAVSTSTIPEMCVVPQPPIASSGDVLSDFVMEMCCNGVVGEDRLVKVTYLALTSRLLDHPVSIVVKGPSSAGKSYVTQEVLRFFPATAYKSLSGMSEHALAYMDEPMSHRFLVVYEAAGMTGETASMFVRTLLSEGRIEYMTVVKTKNGMAPKTLVLEGPTGVLLTTTLVNLHPENETRLLSVPACDTPEQTSDVLMCLANEIDRGSREVDEWHDLQVWLEQGECRVTVPFARRVAELIPPIAVRLRRDFAMLLNMVRAHALLHRATRERDGDGRIVATISDYAVVRELVADLVAAEVEAEVPETVKETVRAVAKVNAENEKPVSIAELARELHLDKSTASRRASQALISGYLKNLEDRKGRPYRYVSGDPLPDDQIVLPRPEDL